MSLLAPLYVLGLLGVSLPVIFHLIRRSPRGRMAFSSLMFLRPTPPRLTRRSRIDNWLLLLLRAAVLCLLALAFARPFLREATGVEGAAVGERWAFLVDTSASMSRGDLWERAVERVRELVSDLPPETPVSLFTFDDSVREEIGPESGAEADAGARRDLLLRRLGELRPGFGATDLGQALVDVADRVGSSVDERAGEGETASERERPEPWRGRVVVVTDLQEGARLDALESFGWPEGARVSVERVRDEDASNAGLELLGARHDEASRRVYRLRITNEAGSGRDRFTVRWETARREDGRSPAACDVYVPPGEQRVVSVPVPEAGSPESGAPGQAIVLEGDDRDFDNRVWVALPPREEREVLWIGPSAVEDPAGPRYYAERALVGTPRSPVRIRSDAREEPTGEDGSTTPADGGAEAASRPWRLAIVEGEALEAARERLLEGARRGATVLALASDAAARETIGTLLGRPDLELEEIEGDYAMLSEIDFGHPVFAPLEGPRFGDFTKIRFWRHRRIRFPGGTGAPAGAGAPAGRGAPGERGEAIRVVARFDDGDPALLERTVGRGRILVLTSGWQPRDSQLALSTKFVPLMARVLDGDRDADGARIGYRVHDVLPIGEGVMGGEEREVRGPDGAITPIAASDTGFRATDRPGIYELASGDDRRLFAVNLTPAESRTAALDVEDLEARGVPLGDDVVEDADDVRRRADIELERSQKIWKGLVVAALGLLVLETWIGGRLARRTTRTEEVA